MITDGGVRLSSTDLLANSTEAGLVRKYTTIEEGRFYRARHCRFHINKAVGSRLFGSKLLESPRVPQFPQKSKSRASKSCGYNARRLQAVRLLTEDPRPTRSEIGSQTGQLISPETRFRVVALTRDATRAGLIASPNRPGRSRRRPGRSFPIRGVDC
jgi:hypothetical protein